MKHVERHIFIWQPLCANQFCIHSILPTRYIYAIIILVRQSPLGFCARGEHCASFIIATTATEMRCGRPLYISRIQVASQAPFCAPHSSSPQHFHLFGAKQLLARIYTKPLQYICYILHIYTHTPIRIYVYTSTLDLLPKPRTTRRANYVCCPQQRSNAEQQFFSRTQILIWPVMNSAPSHWWWAPPSSKRGRDGGMPQVYAHSITA